MTLLLNFLSLSTMVTILGYTLTYLIASFHDPLPWSLGGDSLTMEERQRVARKFFTGDAAHANEGKRHRPYCCYTGHHAFKL
jgi:hypothetical protein